jgi:pyridoxamine 5'-phosphate oxidase
MEPPLPDPTPAPDLAGLRREYGRLGLRRQDLDEDPMAQFRLWLGEATAAALSEPNAMVLATSDGRRCSSRTVLLKAFDQHGLVFFTNHGSRKASDIAANAQVSL